MSPAKITLSVTTCRRLDSFRESFDSLLEHCLDRDRIACWICVDDNSSERDRREMQRTYPWMEFVWKGPERKGHASSIQAIWRRCETDLLFHTEDDWGFSEDFSLAQLERELGDDDQLVLRKRSEIVRGEFNPNHADLTEQQKSLAHRFGFTSDLAPDDGSFWPGFSLNPSLLRLDRCRALVPDVPEGDEFEFEYALRLRSAGFKVKFRPLEVGHRGDLSAYLLNDERRKTDETILLAWIIHTCTSNPGRAIELFDYLELDCLTERQHYDALHALSTAQWYLDRPAGERILREMWRRFGSTGWFFEVGMAEHLGFYGLDCADLSGDAELDADESGIVETKARRSNVVKRWESASPTLASDGEVTMVIRVSRASDFPRAVSSLVEHCSDLELASHWLCVADGIEEEEVEKLRVQFAWVEFASRDDRPGLAGDLAAIRDWVRTPLFFLFDDQTELLDRSDYIGRCRAGLEFCERFGQCLLNANYARGPEESDLEGGVRFRVGGQIYLAHFYDAERLVVRGRSNCHWPHFSVRPGLFRREILDLPIDDVPFFEHSFATRYMFEGWLTIFLPGVHHREID